MFVKPEFMKWKRRAPKGCNENSFFNFLAGRRTSNNTVSGQRQSNSGLGAYILGVHSLRVYSLGLPIFIWGLTYWIRSLQPRSLQPGSLQSESLQSRATDFGCGKAYSLIVLVYSLGLPILHVGSYSLAWELTFRECLYSGKS